MTVSITEHFCNGLMDMKKELFPVPTMITFLRPNLPNFAMGKRDIGKWDI